MHGVENLVFGPDTIKNMWLYIHINNLIWLNLIDIPGQGRKKEFSSWEHNLKTNISCRQTEYCCAKICMCINI